LCGAPLDLRQAQRGRLLYHRRERQNAVLDQAGRRPVLRAKKWIGVREPVLELL